MGSEQAFHAPALGVAAADGYYRDNRLTISVGALGALDAVLWRGAAGAGRHAAADPGRAVAMGLGRPWACAGGCQRIDGGCPGIAGNRALSHRPFGPRHRVDPGGSSGAGVGFDHHMPSRAGRASEIAGT